MSGGSPESFPLNFLDSRAVVYESLDPSSSLGAQMIAGAAAGLMEHCVMYPVDCIKTRMQYLGVPAPAPGAGAGAPQYRGILDAFVKIVRREGPTRPFRGISAMLIGSAPAHALYFACYEQLKSALGRRSGLGDNSVLVQASAACCATVFHDSVMTPADAIKQRIQLFHSPYRSCADCLQRVWRTEGVRALYRSFGTQLMMNLPFQSAHFVVYEASQNALNPTRRYHPLTHLVSGSLAGGVAAFLTTPLDVCKTFLNTQNQLMVDNQLHASLSIPASERCPIAAGERCLYGKNPAFMGTQANAHQKSPSPPCHAGSTPAAPSSTTSNSSASAQRAASRNNPCHPSASQISHQQHHHLSSHSHSHAAAQLQSLSSTSTSSTQVSHAHHIPSRVSPLGSLTGSLAATPTTIAPGLRPLFTGAPAVLSVAAAADVAPARLLAIDGGHAAGTGPSRAGFVRGLAGALREVYRVAGVRGFFLGVSARCVHQMPATAISWSVYEAFKFSLTRREQRGQHLLRHATSESRA